MLHFLQDLWANLPLRSAVMAWAIAQAIKVLITVWLKREWDWRRWFGMGGMPSSHTAFVFSLMLMVGIKEGVASASFALAFALAAVVIYDAMGVRAETGKQGAVLNEILRRVLVEGQPITEDTLKELVGHTPLEVLGGLCVGLAVTLMFA
ncbi:MAG: divergent PAP2 family protein [Clostridia bacterium]|nr:divergent PAP2 family protein [Clostridia bacterium]